MLQEQVFPWMRAKSFPGFRTRDWSHLSSLSCPLFLASKDATAETSHTPLCHRWSVYHLRVSVILGANRHAQQSGFKKWHLRLQLFCSLILGQLSKNSRQWPCNTLFVKETFEIRWKVGYGAIWKHKHRWNMARLFRSMTQDPWGILDGNLLTT